MINRYNGEFSLRLVLAAVVISVNWGWVAGLAGFLALGAFLAGPEQHRHSSSEGLALEPQFPLLINKL